MDETPKRGRRLGPMKPLDRLLVLKVVALGASAYLVPLGIGVLLFALIAALVATWRGSR